MNENLVAAFYGNDVSIYDMTTSKMVRNESDENVIREICYSEKSDIIFALDVEGNLLTLKNATSDKVEPTQAEIPGKTENSKISENELEKIIADEKKNINSIKNNAKFNEFRDIEAEDEEPEGTDEQKRKLEEFRANKPEPYKGQDNYQAFKDRQK